MPFPIEGVTYFTMDEVAREAGVSRQTLWRWRRDGKVPRGHSFRDGQQVLFTLSELQAVREHAHRVEPIGGARDQLGLFNGNDGRRP
jgi:transposase-like protein